MKKNKKKWVCVIGLGQFGQELATNLARHCEVLALDQDENRVNAICDRVQRALVVDVRSQSALYAVVSPDFDEAVVSIGSSMEASILCTLHLKRLGIPQIRAKAANDDHAAILQSIGATQVIFPERETAQRIANRIVHSNLLDFVPLAEDYRVMEVIPPESFHGHNLLELNLRKNYGIFVIAVKSTAPARFLFLPGPDHVVQPSDVLVMIGREKNLLQIQEARPILQMAPPL